jgi:hypothetical protein
MSVVEVEADAGELAAGDASGAVDFAVGVVVVAEAVRPRERGLGVR